MAGRVWKWVVFAGVLGALPLPLAYGIRYYYAAHPPPLTDVLASGDGLLVATAWAAGALLEVLDVPPSRPRVRWLAALPAIITLVWSTVAFTCLSADSVTGRVQTRRQADTVTDWSVGLLVLGAAAGLTAAAAATPPRRREDSC